MLQQATKEKYGIETLKERNVSYDHEHGLTQKDVDMANNHVQLIERTRSEVTPANGDRLVYVTEHGDYYGNALIDGKVQRKDTYHMRTALCSFRVGRRREHPSECQRRSVPLRKSEGHEIPEMDGRSVQGLGTLRCMQPTVQ